MGLTRGERPSSLQASKLGVEINMLIVR